MQATSASVYEFPSSPDVEHALGVFSRLQGCLLLDSSRQSVSTTGRTLGRYSFLMADPIDQVDCRSVDDVPQTLTRIDQWIATYKAEIMEGLPPMQGGVAGLFSYDLNLAFESIPRSRNDEFETPLISVGLYDAVLAWDHLEGRAWLIANAWRDDSQTRLEYFRNLLDQFPAEDGNLAVPDEDACCLENQHQVDGPEGLLSNFSKEQYLQAAKASIEYIFSGDVFQVNLAQRLVMQQTCGSVELYHRLRQCNSSPFGGYFDFGGGQVVSASPERLISVCDGFIETRPIKGTRMRTGRPMVDIAASRKLEASEKDHAENTMIVDLMRNDLSQICTDDSIKVTQLCEIEEYQSVMHLVSAVEGKLKNDRCKPSELLKAVFPGGSITGAPKVRAMEIIAELEPSARGAYCGSLGYFSINGSVDLNILIRTITASKGWWQIPVGGGIVSQSDPESEYRETWTKAAGMLNATVGKAESSAK